MYKGLLRKQNKFKIIVQLRYNENNNKLKYVLMLKFEYFYYDLFVERDESIFGHSFGEKKTSKNVQWFARLVPSSHCLILTSTR